MKAAAALGDEKAPCPRADSQPRLAPTLTPSLPPSLPSQLLLTTRTLVDGAGASEFPEEFRSQELRQVQGGGKPDPGRQAGLGGRGGAGWLGTGHRLGMGPRGSRELLLLPDVPPQPVRCGAMVVGAVIVVGLGMSQQGCGWREGGRNPRALVCQCVCVWGCLNAQVWGCANACCRSECVCVNAYNCEGVSENTCGCVNLCGCREGYKCL